MFKPLNNRVLLKPDEENITKGGIVLVESKFEKPSVGTVIVGNKEVKKGQRIVFSKYGYDEIEIDGEKHYVVSDFNILGIFI